ncbi:MAG: hypothetical protein COW00_18075 [Bdellovibrio sp. CG12_big_fil_rev_8_21_14_0_65_39_13]|nr:MAG: hypothetical protein COW78_06095 [Bdellovibrio sp. CG22_combo_CG10-13_8_21_14_all_39_27]PIQ58017.1 MAG: hypothetical protein COW00_18075 [Bdellovibrio sp. CG12_big_fil_rev_8_21_14_0_65_39_13]PIR36927.1 MAG: hypothetical protein COV37_00105 [Bdellovibrio sp. CG11_big_fil_rev_8_21_14_0_20_39_38]PJB53303.1 MAG: hypothetical protein CO099_07895 [Bdellovibrio sp. CG_4_9_14_3_um_filter_39_7]
MIPMKERSQFYFYWVGPLFLLVFLIALLPISASYPLNLMCGYLWVMALRSTELKEKTLDRQYRMSFIKFIFKIHEYSKLVYIPEKLNRYKESLHRMLGPFVFALLLFIISLSFASVLMLLGAILFEWIWVRYTLLGVDTGPLK